VYHDPVVVITAALMLSLTRTVKPRARNEGESMVLEYGWPMKSFAIAGWLFFLGIMVWIALAAEPGQRERALVVFACFLVLPLLLHLEFFHVSVRYDVHGLQTKSPWRRNRAVPWEDITGVTFEKTPQWYALATTRYGKVRVPFWLSGIESLLSELQRRGFIIPQADLTSMVPSNTKSAGPVNVTASKTSPSRSNPTSSTSPPRTRTPTGEETPRS
jgi:hypothetical protein